MKNNGLFLRVLWIVSGVLSLQPASCLCGIPRRLPASLPCFSGVVLLLRAAGYRGVLKMPACGCGGRLDIDRWTPHRADGGLSAVQPVAGRPRNSGDLLHVDPVFRNILRRPFPGSQTLWSAWMGLVFASWNPADGVGSVVVYPAGRRDVCRGYPHWLRSGFSGSGRDPLRPVFQTLFVLTRT